MNQSNLYTRTPIKTNEKSFSTIGAKNSNNIRRYNYNNLSKNQK